MIIYLNIKDIIWPHYFERFKKVCEWIPNLWIKLEDCDLSKGKYFSTNFCTSVTHTLILLSSYKYKILNTYNECSRYKYKNTYKESQKTISFLSIKLKYFNTYNEYGRTPYKYNTSNTYNETPVYFSTVDNIDFQLKAFLIVPDHKFLKKVCIVRAK